LGLAGRLLKIPSARVDVGEKLVGILGSGCDNGWDCGVRAWI